MNADKRLDIQLRSFVYERMLGVLPNDFPHRRELRIQNGKLQRMLADGVKGVDHFYGAARILGGSTKLKREEGEKDARIVQQERKVKRMLEESLKEWFQLGGKPMTNAQFHKWRMAFGKGIEEGTTKLKKQVTEQVIDKMMDKAPELPS